MVRSHRSLKGQLGVLWGPWSKERQPGKLGLVTTGGRGHRLGTGWSHRSWGIHTIELGSGQCCKLTLVVGLWPGQKPGLGLGLLPRVKLLPESWAASLWALLWPMT